MSRRSSCSLAVFFVVLGWSFLPMAAVTSPVEERMLGAFPGAATKMGTGGRAATTTIKTAAGPVRAHELVPEQVKSTEIARALVARFPQSYRDPFVVSHGSQRIAIRPVDAAPVTAETAGGKVAYQGAYPATDLLYTVGPDRVMELMFLDNPAAPTRFVWDIVEIAGVRDVVLVNGKVRFHGARGGGLVIERPWVMDADGRQSDIAISWALERTPGGQRRLVLNLNPAGLRYPLLVDPSWSVTGAMQEARSGHTATLLLNGKVLVAGGEPFAGTSTPGCEIYDLSTGTWSSAAPMSGARRDHTATLLPSGKVLVVGGRTGASTALATAELYDPGNNTWTPTTQSLGAARYLHTATLLADGRVLVAAGSNGAALNTSELYDPLAGTWAATLGQLATARYGHTATILTNSQSSTQKVLVAGGWGAGAVPLDRAELYDPVARTWSSAGIMRSARAGHTATLLDGSGDKVLVAGGQTSTGAPPVSTCEVYDQLTGWNFTGSMGSPRMGHSTALLGTSPPWQSTNSRVLVAGGLTVGGSETTAVEIYDPSTATWSPNSPNTPLTVPRQKHASVLLPNGMLLLVGGTSLGSSLGTAENYQPATMTRWGPANMAETNGRYLHKAKLLPNGKVLISGGYNPTTGSLTSTELYDAVGAPANGAPTDATWIAKHSHTLTLLPDGRALAAGGQPGDGRFVLEIAELFNPTAPGPYGNGDWTLAPSMRCRHGLGHTATLLPNGKVLIVGGFGGVLGNETCAQFSTPGLTVSYTNSTPVVAPPGSGGSSNIVVPDAHNILDVNVRVNISGVYNEGRAFDGVGLKRSGGTSRYLSCAGDGEDPYPLTNTVFDDEAATSMCAGSPPYTGSFRPGQSLNYFDGATSNTTWTLEFSNLWGENPITLQNWTLTFQVYPELQSTKASELYDPVANTWTRVGDLATARRWHSATLLTTGEVLVTGGETGNLSGAWLSSAELFDPTTNTWSSAGNMATPRREPAAVLLANGTVLVAGGSGSGGSSEIYDPFVPLGPLTWTPTGSMSAEVRHPESIRLPDGRPMVAGGSDGSVPIDRVELYDVVSGQFSLSEPLSVRRQHFPLTLQPTGDVMYCGGYVNPNVSAGIWRSSRDIDASRRPVITSTVPQGTSVDPLRYGLAVDLEVQGTGFQGDSEASSGTTQASAVKYPLLHLRSIENDFEYWLDPDPQLNFSDPNMRLRVSDLPPGLAPGYYLLTVVVEGVPSVSKIMKLGCSLAVTDHPDNQSVPELSVATFAIDAQGASTYSWEWDDPVLPVGNWQPAPGPNPTNQSSYTTPPVTIAQHDGALFRCVVANSCGAPSASSNPALLRVISGTPPTVTVVAPTGGEYWPLSPISGPSNSRTVSWDMSDPDPGGYVCRVEIKLYYSSDGISYFEATSGGGLPAVFGSGPPGCPPETTESLVYTLPKDFPSGTPGSLYKVKVSVTDDAGLVSEAWSPNPFFIVRPDPVNVKTLILANIPRMQAKMGISQAEADALAAKLMELASNARVQGAFIDLSKSTRLASLYASWDSTSADPVKANEILFGCAAPCVAEDYGIHDLILTLKAIYPAVKYVVIVGDDRIVPMARLRDRTALLPEVCYVDPASPLCPGSLAPVLSATGTTVGQATAANKYLSDDPVAVLDDVEAASLDLGMYVPDLSLGRLVENPSDIIATIDGFTGQGGVLYLGAMDPDLGHKVMIMGYDFLVDGARKIRKRWKSALGVTSPADDTEPVNGRLITDWQGANPAARIQELHDHLAGTIGTGAGRFGVVSMNGHATHFEEGIPGGLPGQDGLEALDIHGDDTCGNVSGLGALGLQGSIGYAVGCHGGLPVAGSCSSTSPPAPDYSLDIPESMMSRGVVFFAANTGYGWGLRFGVGYSERLVEIFTEELTKGGGVSLGDAMRRTKQRYFMETPRIDAYDEKCLQEWSAFGLPMYSLDAGIATLAPAPTREERTDGTVVEKHGAVGVQRREGPVAPDAPPLPPYLTQLTLSFDFSAAGVYSKWKADGDPETQTNGCSDPAGCYYALNGLSERATVNSDLPIQPYFVYDSRLSGTSQHGVIWKGGVYAQESNWIPVVGELISNGGDGSDHGSAPRVVMISPIAPRLVPGADPPGCAATDTELNGLVVTAGEAAKNLPTDPLYNLERRYMQVDLETFYYNNSSSGQGNCDRTGPTLGAGPFAGKYHQLSGTQIDWAVPVTDGAPPDPNEVWRVLVVATDEILDAQNRGRWTYQELNNDGTGTWRGTRTIAGVTRLTYVVQAVDKRGNVTWHGFVGVTPSSGVPLGVPEPVDAELLDSDGDGMPDAYEDLHPCLSKTAPDGSGDPDFDYLTSLQEFAKQTLPCTTDSDGGGDNDGSEENNARDPVDPADDFAMTILLTKVGGGVDVAWPDASGSNALIDGYYHVYRSSTPTFAATDKISGSPIPNGTTVFTDATPTCNPCFYKVWNREVAPPPPIVDVVTPSTGPTSGGTRISVYGDNFAPGATVTICGVPATAVTFVNSTKLQCTTPANPPGSCTVRVTNPAGQSGSKPAAFTYQ